MKTDEKWNYYLDDKDCTCMDLFDSKEAALKAALESKFCVCEAEYILRIMCGEEAVTEAYKRAQELLGAV